MSFRLNWQHAIRESGLRSTARHVALTLALRMNEHGLCWPSIETLAAETGLGEKTVRRRRDELIECGWLVVERRRGRRGRDGENVSIYRATFPPESRSQGPDLEPGMRSLVPRNPVARSEKSGHGDHRTRKELVREPGRLAAARSNGGAAGSPVVLEEECFGCGERKAVVDGPDGLFCTDCASEVTA